MKIIIKEEGVKKVLVHEGFAGKAGVSVTNAEIQNNNLVFTMSDGSTVHAGTILPPMPDADGKDYFLCASADRSGVEWRQV